MTNLPPYAPPSAAEPLDAVQQALVRALIDIIVSEIREELRRDQAFASCCRPDVRERTEREP